jgi:hypothetical protein
LHGLEVEGRSKWVAISKIVGTRNALQVKNHANEHFRKLGLLPKKRARTPRTVRSTASRRPAKLANTTHNEGSYSPAAAHTGVGFERAAFATLSSLPVQMPVQLSHCVMEPARQMDTQAAATPTIAPLTPGAELQPSLPLSTSNPLNTQSNPMLFCQMELAASLELPAHPCSAATPASDSRLCAEGVLPLSTPFSQCGPTRMSVDFKPPHTEAVEHLVSTFITSSTATLQQNELSSQLGAPSFGSACDSSAFLAFQPSMDFLCATAAQPGSLQNFTEFSARGVIDF